MIGLFSSFTLKGVTLRNRIVVTPMCQYMAQDGVVNEWHQTHYTTMAKGGAGLVVLEATAVSPEGRITPGDLGIWDDSHTEGLASVAHAIKGAGSVAGIQLAHAGRKAGCTPPWEGGAPVPVGDSQAWQPVAPSAVPYIDGSAHVPREMTLSEIQQVQQDFVDGARRASEAGFEWLELHFAHGFLAQNFLSTSANQRSDAYGGSLENRARFLVETVAAVRKVWPTALPLTARVGVVDFAVGAEVSLGEAEQLLYWLKEAGLDFVDAGLSLATAGEDVPWGPNLMIPYAERVRRKSTLPVGTSWSITSAQDADSFIRSEKVDLVFLGRSLLANPHWPYQAARELGIKAPADVLPTPYAYWLASWAG